MPSFVDTNVPMYARGGPHELRASCIEILGLIAGHPGGFVTDSEVLQEILHRYFALGRRDEGRTKMFDFANLMWARIEPTYAADVYRAGELASQYSRLEARDLIHLAVMERVGCDSVISADRDFDGLLGIRRLDPRRLEDWRRDC